ncbi:hypothetical protein ES703_95975 [subsurface metagenome]
MFGSINQWIVASSSRCSVSCFKSLDKRHSVDLRVKECRISSSFHIDVCHVDKEKLVGNRGEGSEFRNALIFIIVCARKIDGHSIIHTDMIGYRSERNQGTSWSNPGLNALSGCSQLQHMLLFPRRDQSALQGHGIIADPESGITVPAARSDKNSSCIVPAKSGRNLISRINPGAFQYINCQFFKKLKISWTQELY